jgi:RNA polymerase sigma-70 factor (ECF subfamily)
MSRDGVQTAELLSDEEIVRRFQTTGDNAWFAELFNRHRRYVYLACCRFFSDGGTAEDVTQDAFTRAYRNIHRFVDGDVRAWLVRIARNACIDYYRKLRPERPLDDIASAEPLAPGSTDQRLDLRMAVQRLRQEMTTLPVEQRRCLEMKIEGYSYEDTASHLGLTIAAVKSHLQNGRRMLWLRMKGSLPD